MNNMKEMVFGFVPTQFDGTEYVITEEKLGTLPLPASYSYLPFMSPIMDQGSTSTCVPHSISAVYDYYIAMNHPELTNNGQFKNSGISIQQIYKSRTNFGEGMSYKEAFSFCLHKGVVTEQEYKQKKLDNPMKIYMYGRLMSMEVLKRALVANGPCPIATMVRNIDRSDFWNGSGNYGGHATCLVGYSDKKEAFILRNSWGKSFGSGGYTWFPYSDFNKILEAWTVLI